MNRVPESEKLILEQLRRNGYEAWFVGGCVRDILRGEKPHDWDICTSALPEQTAECFSEDKILLTGARHGTVAVLRNKQMYEITTYRVDGAYTDGRRPDGVEFVRNLKDDLARRDFTMNAIAMDGSGCIYDPFGGGNDIASGIIRCVGNPDIRFREDGLRVLRALRFASVLGFDIEPETAAAIYRNAQQTNCVATERITDEISKLLPGCNAGNILREFGPVLCKVWPELLPYADDIRWNAMTQTITHSVSDLRVRLALLLSLGGSVCDAVAAEQCMHGLRLDHNIVKQVYNLVGSIHITLEANECSLCRLLYRIGPEQLRLLIRTRKSLPVQGEREVLDRISVMLEDILKSGQCWSLGQLAVSGRDVISIGIPAGPAVGKILHALLKMVIEGSLPNDRQILMDYMQRMQWKNIP